VIGRLFQRVVIKNKFLKIKIFPAEFMEKIVAFIHDLFIGDV
jgi:hypothetical protein